MVEGKHSIEKIEMSFNINDPSRAKECQNFCSSLFNDHFSSTLELLLDEIDNPAKRIVIDRVEVDLGIVSTSNLSATDQKFKELIRIELSDKMEAKLQEDALDSTTSKSDFQDFFYFLNYGHLPWNSDFGSEYDSEMMKHIEKKWDYDASVNFLIHLTSRNILIRWKSLPTAFQKIITLKVNIALEKQRRNFSTPNRSSSNKSQRIDQAFYADKLVFSNHSHLGKFNIELEKLIRFFNISDQTIKLDQDIKRERLASGITIENAGLNLCVPIFSQLFENLNLYKDNAFINERAQFHAVKVLFYLSFKNEIFSESKASYCKILSGLNSDTAMLYNGDLSAEEMVLCDEALDSIVQEWKALKSTSSDAFRNSFIQRIGLIKQSDNAIEIHLEDSGIDYFIQYNPPPWSIGMVHLPWLDKIIYVNWK